MRWTVLVSFLAFASAASAQTNPPASALLVPTNAVWHYWDAGTDLGTAWRALGYDERHWPSGPARLGYGEGDEQTWLRPAGPNSGPIATYYFRHQFAIPEPVIVPCLRLRLLPDDGAVVYLNGVEVRRDNLPAGEITAGTWAAWPAGYLEEGRRLDSLIPPLRLRMGTNVLAVEVHQYAGSEDLSFDLELAALPRAGVPLADALDGTNLTWRTGGDVPWFGQTNVTLDGTDAAQSGQVPAGAGSWIETTVEGPGVLRHDCRARTENDQTRFYMFEDGRQVYAYSNATHLAWAPPALASVPPGSHTYRWLIENTSPHGGSGVAWLDQVTYHRVPVSPPHLESQPVSQVVAVGDRVTFNVAVSGLLPFYYQWLWNGTPLAGATNASFVIAQAAFPDAGQYEVAVSNAHGSVRSAAAALTVLPARVSLAEALDATNLVWSTDPTSPVWFGQTNVTHDGHAAAQAGVVFCESTSWLETTVTGPARVRWWWKLHSGAAFGSLSFWVPTADCQLELRGNTDWEPASLELGAGTFTLRWSCYLENSHPGGPNGGWVDEVVVEPSGAQAPVIVGQPVNQTVAVGETADFHVEATGTPLLRYQWRKNEAALAGQTNATLPIANAQPAHAGAYSVIVANAFGAVTSAVATLTVVAPPAIPRIAGVSPASATVGTSVSIVGTNFSAAPEANVVYFGAVRATVMSASATQLGVTVPSGATYAPISVTVNGRTAWANAPFGITFSGPGQINASTLAPRVDLPAGDGPIHVVVADLNRDGKPDLAVVNYFNSTLSVYQNVSQAGLLQSNAFAPPFNLPTGANPSFLVAADVDGDGWLDLVTANYGASSVSVIRNRGVSGVLSPAAFAPRLDWGMGLHPMAVGAGDLDGDGRPEIVTANNSANTVSVRRNRSTPGQLAGSDFALDVEWQAGAGPHSVALGDLDGDRKPELVVGNRHSATISVFHNRSVPGTFVVESLAPPVHLPAGGKTVALGDLDGDGRLDIASGSWDAHTVSLRRNLGTSGVITSNSFAPAVTLPTGGFTHTVALGDLDGDGHPDLAAVTEMPSQLVLYHNGSNPGDLASEDFQQQAVFGTRWNAVGVAVGDLDGDGRLDVAHANTYDDVISVRRNIAGPSLPPASFVTRQLPPAYAPGAPLVVQLNAQPAGAVSTYAVEDRPPVNWTVANVSHDGAFDARTGKVKFGPFYDAEPRVLHYQITPPDNAVGTGLFAGTASADGVDTPVGGPNRLELIRPLHPADQQAPTNVLTIAEVTAYGAAWRRGEPWPQPPTPILMDYVTRAAFLWRSGECYGLDARTNPPLGWIPCAQGAWPGATGQPASFGSGISPTATRQLPPTYVPGVPLAVSLVTAPGDALGWAVEEQLPAGGSPVQISHGGEVAAAGRSIRWGPYLDATPRALSYQLLVPPAAGVVRLEGVASFDGHSVPILGADQTLPTVRLLGVVEPGSGLFRLQVQGRAASAIEVQASSDLVTWETLGELPVVEGQIEVDGPPAGRATQRFYRARPGP